jgi:hypothetical protein
MKAMTVLQKFLFTLAMVMVLSFAVSAQKNDPKKPPKPPPPVVTPGEKKPPKGEDRPKKPHGEVSILWIKADGESA